MGLDFIRQKKNCKAIGTYLKKYPVNQWSVEFKKKSLDKLFPINRHDITTISAGEKYMLSNNNNVEVASFLFYILTVFIL